LRKAFIKGRVSEPDYAKRLKQNFSSLRKGNGCFGELQSDSFEFAQS